MVKHEPEPHTLVTAKSANEWLTKMIKTQPLH